MAISGLSTSSPDPTETGKHSRLASPLAMAVIIPLLVLASGLAIAWITRTALLTAAEATAARTLMQSTARTRREICQSLEQAGPMLDNLRRWLRAGPDLGDDAGVARVLLGIANGRRGVALVSISTATGDFHAVQPRADGWIYLRSAVTADGATPGRAWNIAPDGALTPVSDEANSGYDPRQRPFYLAALRNRGRSWTDPYPFFIDGITGITCAEPVGDAAGPAGAVMAVDFNLDSLGAVLQQADSESGSASFLFTAEHVLLGLPTNWRPAGMPEGPRRLLKAEDLAVTPLSAYFAALPALPQDHEELPPFIVRHDGEDLVAAVGSCRIDDGPRWYIGMLLPRVALLGDTDRHLRLSLIIGLAVLGLATAVAAWFARHLARSRSEAASARAQARKAEAAANEMGSYRLVKLLGRGGMGEVWLAQHRMLARPAAIKLIKAENLQGLEPEHGEEVRKRFAAEARLTASLRSRNTIELYDYGIAEDGTFYYVMELLDGIDLHDLVLRYGPLPPARVVHLLIQACNSLDEAHERGLVHRDIKPENLFICRHASEVDVLKVLDFGIVRMQRPDTEMAKTREGLVQGTPATMSPEQACDQPLDGRSDLYSLGCVAYWLLSGSQVFDGENAMELLNHHVGTTPVPPSVRMHRPLPQGLEDLVMRCLAKDPAQRPATARLLAHALLELDLGREEPWDAARQRNWWERNLPPRPELESVDGAEQVFSPRGARLQGS
jgi:serine/threonine protein kinase